MIAEQIDAFFRCKSNVKISCPTPIAGNTWNFWVYPSVSSKPICKRWFISIKCRWVHNLILFYNIYQLLRTLQSKWIHKKYTARNKYIFFNRGYVWGEAADVTMCGPTMPFGNVCTLRCQLWNFPAQRFCDTQFKIASNYQSN